MVPSFRKALPGAYDAGGLTAFKGAFVGLCPAYSLRGWGFCEHVWASCPTYQMGGGRCLELLYCCIKPQPLAVANILLDLKQSSLFASLRLAF